MQQMIHSYYTSLRFQSPRHENTTHDTEKSVKTIPLSSTSANWTHKASVNALASIKSKGVANDAPDCLVSSFTYRS